jgi:exonuclease VII small subunit
MPVGCKALNSIQLVAGCDFHKQMPPPPPAGPLPMAPHAVVSCMGFAMPATAKQSTTVKVGGGYAIGRQHDLGAGMYHFAPNTLLPLIWAGAGNKAEFGSSTVSIDVGDKSLRMAVALPRRGSEPAARLQRALPDANQRVHRLVQHRNRRTLRGRLCCGLRGYDRRHRRDLDVVEDCGWRL